MRKQDIYIGNIMKASNYMEHTVFDKNIEKDKFLNRTYKFGYVTYDKELYKENVVLLKVQDGFIDLEEVTSIWYLIMADNLSLDYRKLVKFVFPSCDGEYYIDENSLVSFYSKDEIEKAPKTTLKTVKQKRLKRIKNRTLS